MQPLFNQTTISMLKYYLLLFISSWHIASFANDECPDATTLTPGTACSYTNGTFTGASLSGIAPSCTPNASQDVWFKFTATDATNRISIPYTPGADVAFQILQGSCNGTVLACVNYDGFNQAETYINNNYIIGQEYYIRVLNANAQASTADFLICVTSYPAPANDACANAIQITPNIECNYQIGAISGALKDGGPTGCAADALQDVWYKFTATDATMSISMTYTSGMDQAFQILQGGCNGTVVACVNNQGVNQEESYLNNNFVIGQEYYLRVMNAGGFISTSNFQFCIKTYPAPSNDLCANAIEITPNVQCNYQIGAISGALKDGGPTGCAANALQDVWYKFTATDATIGISMTYSSGMNQAFQILQGGCNGTVVACINNQGLNQEENYLDYNFVIGQEYYLRVMNAGGFISTSNFQFCIKTYPAPSNDLCANAIEITPNVQCNYQIGTISGALKDGGPTGCASDALQDVWYKFTATAATIGVNMTYSSGINQAFQILQGGCNGTVIACINNQSFNQEESYVGSIFVIGQEYYLRVMNAGGFISTSNIQLCITAYPAAANDLCANATEVIPGSTCTYTGGSFSGTFNDGAAISCAANATQDIWYKFVATEQTNSIYLNPVSGLDLGFEIRQGGCQGTLVDCVNSSGFNTSEFYLNNNFIVGQTYYLRFFNATGSMTTQNMTFCIIKYPKPANDTCANATVLYQNATCSAVAATLTGAMPDGAAMGCAANSGQDVWFRFTALGNSAQVYVGPAFGADLAFEVYQGGCSGTVLLCVNGNGTNVSETTLVPGLTQGMEYYIRVVNVNPSLSTDNFTICVYGNIEPCTPTITITASATAICAGTAVTFTAASTYVGPSPQYQWKVNGSVMATGPTYTTSTLAGTDVVTCSLTSSAACAQGTVVSSNALSVDVTPLAVPTFTQIAPICQGDVVVLPATSGNGIAGAWSPAVNTMATTTYTFTPDAGQCATTAAMTVTVKTVDASVTTQGNTITAMATAELYQWYECTNGVIPGATTQSFTPDDTGSYAVMVTQNGCSKMSVCTDITILSTGTFEKDGWLIYPNPAADLLFIRLDQATAIMVADMTGKVVLQKALKQGENTVEVSALTAGVYLIHSHSGHVMKFVKK